MSRQERSYSPGWRIFVGRLLQVLLRALTKHEQQGRQYLPREGGVIVAPNHLSYADWGAVAIYSYESGRFPTFLIKSSIFSVKGVGSLLRIVGQLPVYRNRGDAALVLKAAEAALRDNQCIIVYPEGTASRDPGLWPMVGKTGAARLALKTGVPVIPVAHWGAQDVLPYGSTRPHVFPRRTIRLVAGPPVDLSAFKGKPLTATNLREATAVIMADVTALLAGLRQETPPAVPFDPAAASPPSSIGRTDADPVTAVDAAGTPPGGPGIAAGEPAGSPADDAETAEGPETEARPT
ncbi:MAG TPA: lysophospholipid acyltransferase family protein [Streptosporangiaceae bacterium]